MGVTVRAPQSSRAVLGSPQSPHPISPHPVGCRCPGMGVMGTAYPHPAEDWGVQALQALSGSRGVPDSPPGGRAVEWLQLERLQLELPRNRRGSAQPRARYWPRPAHGGAGGTQSPPPELPDGETEARWGISPRNAAGYSPCVPSPPGSSEQEQEGKILEPSKQRELPLLSCGKWARYKAGEWGLPRAARWRTPVPRGDTCPQGSTNILREDTWSQPSLRPR